MNILDNERVRKYFGCGCETAGCLHPHEAILKSMQEPINKGEKFLWFNSTTWTLENNSSNTTAEHLFHPYALRLPDQFQPGAGKECECTELRKSTCRCWVGLHPCETHKCIHQPPPAPEKFECTHNYGVMGVGCVEWCKGKPADSERPLTPDATKAYCGVAADCGKCSCTPEMPCAGCVKRLADSGKCGCKGYCVGHDSEKAVEDQFMKAAEECGKFIRARFEKLARATK